MAKASNIGWIVTYLEGFYLKSCITLHSLSFAIYLRYHNVYCHENWHVRATQWAATHKHCEKRACIWSYSGPHFPVFGVRILRIQSKCGKIRTKIAPTADTFYVVKVIWRNQRGKLNTLYFHLQKTYGHQTSQGSNLPWQAALKFQFER